MKLSDTDRVAFLVRHAAYLLEDGEGGEGGDRTPFMVVRSSDGRVMGRGGSPMLALDVAMAGEGPQEDGSGGAASATAGQRRRLVRSVLVPYVLVLAAVGAFATSPRAQQRIRGLAQHVTDIGLVIAATFDRAAAALGKR